MVSIVENFSFFCPRMTSGNCLCSRMHMATVKIILNKKIPQSQTTKDWLRDRAFHITIPIAVFSGTPVICNWEKRTCPVMEAESHYWQFLSGTIHDIFLLRTRIYSYSCISCLADHFLLGFREILMKTFKIFSLWPNLARGNSCFS